MMNGKDDLVRHFKGWPQTSMDARKNIIHIHAKYVSPRMWRLRNSLFFLGLIGLLFLAFDQLAFIDNMLSSGRWIELVAGTLIGIGVFYFILYKLCRATAQIEFTPQTIRIKKHARIGWSEYERGLPHTFGGELHDKAESEAKSDLKHRRRTGEESPELYRQTFKIYMDHVDGRVYIADVMGKKWATMFLARLNGVNEFMDTFLNRSRAARVISQYSDVSETSSYDAPVDDEGHNY